MDGEDEDEEDKVVEDDGSVEGSRRATFAPAYPTWPDVDRWGARFRTEELWTKGLETSTVLRDIHLTLSPVSGEAPPDLLSLTVVELGLETVAFTGDGLDGIPMQDHYKDMDGDNQRDEPGEEAADNDISVAPEWVADDVDVPEEPDWLQDGPDADDVPERDKHALVPRNTRFKVKAVFNLEGIDFGAGEVCAWATCADDDLALGSGQKPVGLQKVGDKWEGTFQIEKAPTVIRVLEDFTWNWHVKLRGQVACTSDTSTHTVFVCRQALTEYKPYDWVAGWSCDWAPSNPQNDEQILDEFIKRDNLESTGMRYVYPDPHPEPDPTVGDLLAYNEGACGNWTVFFDHLGRVQGIDVTLRVVLLRFTAQDWYICAECLRTFPAAGINQAELAYVLSQHGFAEYSSKVYDPSFAVKHTGDWMSYIVSLTDHWAVERDAFNPANWVPCHGGIAPEAVHWVDAGPGDYGALLQEQLSGEVNALELQNP